MFIILRCWSSWNFNKTSRERIPVTTHLRECTKSFSRYFVLEDLIHCQCRENAGTSPLRSLFGWKVRGVWLSLCTSSQTCSLETNGNQQQGSWVSDLGLPLLPPGWCLPGSSFLAWKCFCRLFSINHVFHIKKGRKQGKLLLFNHGTLFSLWFSTIRELA